MSQDLSQYPYMNPTFLISEEKKDSNHSILTIKPLEKGYGHTVGNSLRRVLLSSLPGAAITKVRIEGADHQFSTIKGVKEDVINLLLNLKQIKIKADGAEEGLLRIELDEAGEVTAADLECEAGFEIVNPKQHIATLDKGGKLSMELTVESGVGYRVGDETKKSIGEVEVDAIFSPVVRVSYKVESTRVGRRTDYDKLILDVMTDGTITPKDAIEQSALILTTQFNQFVNPVIPEKKETGPQLTPEEAETLRLTVEELDLPTRIANALRRGGYKNVGDLVEASGEDIGQVKNIGEKSVLVVRESLKKKGVSLK
ncbi:MAG: DNA-directed RNA polymerase subunit alpha [Patescibacteria group bacterium]|nr:DNA-directed RNA polymerase subunit alpha [Patescibacteria group bacterium]